jgi:integrase
MPTLKPVIRKKSKDEFRVDKRGKATVFLRYIYEGKPAYFNTGVKVIPLDWDSRNEVVNSVRLISKSKKNEELLVLAKRNDSQNNQLIRLKKLKIEAAIGQLDINDIEKSADEIKNLLNGKSQNKTVLEFWEMFGKYQDRQKSIYRKNTQKASNSLKGKLESYEKFHNKKLKFENVNLSFYDSFLKYLTVTDSLKPNTVGYYIKTLKAFLFFARDHGAEVAVDLRKFKKPTEKKEIIYLTEEELYKLYIHDYSTAKLRQIADLFCFHASVGLRISDLKRVSASNIINDEIRISSSVKTDKPMRIPLNPLAVEILEKYMYKLPLPSEKNYNELVKKAAEVAGIDTSIEVTDYKDGVKLFSHVPKHKLITTHIAVKTFITHCLERGMLPKVVAEITGKSLKVILEHYYGIDIKTIQDSFRKAWTK